MKTHHHAAPYLDRHRATSALAILLFFGATTVLSAQSAVDTISDASRIRITVPALGRLNYVVPLDSLRRDTLFLSRVPPIPAYQVHSLELSRGKSSHLQSTARGASRGFLVGAVVGVALLTAGFIEDRRTPCGDCFITATGAAAVLTGGTLILTTSIGTVVGLVRRPERWVKVRLN